MALIWYEVRVDLFGNSVVTGALVSHELFGYGRVMRAEGEKITVFFDDSGEPMVFASSNELSRVAFASGKRVKRQSTGRIGVITGQGSGESPKWVVWHDPNEIAEEVLEADLRPASALDPYERALEGTIVGGSRQTSLTTATHFLLREHSSNDLVSLSGSRVDVKPHQVSVVHRVVTSPPHRFLLCDEVGLGKTIEAGMIIKELRERMGAERVLIVVPANLKRQWQFEMKSKFNEVFAILDSVTVKALANNGEGLNPFTQFDRIIVSSSWIAGKTPSKLALEAGWDIVVVDEAHHARSHRSGKQVQLYRFIKALTDISRNPSMAALFLTATPMQLDSHELYSLIEMLDPALFPSEGDFASFREALPELNDLAKLIHDVDLPLSGLTAAQIQRLCTWLELDETVVRQFIDTDNRQELIDRLGRKHLISEILIRNRKANIAGFMPREAHRIEVELSRQEEEVLASIEKYVESGIREADQLGTNALGFRMTSYQKMMASSLRTIKESLSRRLAKLDQPDSAIQGEVDDLEALLVDLEVERDEVTGSFTSVESTTDSFGSEPESAARADGEAQPTQTESEPETLRRLIRQLDAITVDSKAKVLVEKMEDFKDLDTPKVLIFTEYRGTQEYLAELLRKSGWTVNLFHGSQTPQQKDASVDQFRTGPGPQVLIATEAGAEGRNFQFCHVIINYDLPWNPMVVEQRIGRVDRIGQENIVLVFNMSVKGSIEERILDVLEKRINLFELTVGGLDPILGQVASDVREIMNKAKADRPQALEQLGKRLEQQVEEARRANDRLQDLIMDTKSYRVGIAEQLTKQKSIVNASVQEAFMISLLRAQGTYIKRQPGTPEYSVVFHDPFRGRHPELFKNPEDIQRRAVFRNEERVDSDYVQFMAFGHPVIEAAAQDVTAPYWNGSFGTRRIFAGEDLHPSSGWFFLYEVTEMDVRTKYRTLPVFVTDDGEVDLDAADRIVQRSLSIDELSPDAVESTAPISQESRDFLPRAKTEADLIASNLVKELETSLLQTANERIDRETKKIEGYFAYRIEVAARKIQNIEETVERLQGSSDEEQRRIIPVWQSNLKKTRDQKVGLENEFEQQLNRLRSLRNLPCSARLVQIVRVEIIAN